MAFKAVNADWYRSYLTENRMLKWNHISQLQIHFLWLGYVKMWSSWRVNSRGYIVCNTNSMEHSPNWEPNWFSASQEVSCVLWNPKVHYCIRHPSLFWARSIQSMPPSHFLKSHFKIIFPFMPGSCKWSLSLRFLRQNPVYASPLPCICHTPRQSHSSWFYHLNNVGWALQITKLPFM